MSSDDTDVMVWGTDLIVGYADDVSWVMVWGDFNDKSYYVVMMCVAVNIKSFKITLRCQNCFWYDYEYTTKNL